MITINAKELSKALSLVLSSAERKTTMPILAFVKFESDGRNLKLTGTDIDTWLSLNLSAESDAGSFCAPAKQLLSLVSLMDGEVKIDPQEQVIVSSGRSVYKLPKASSEDFPVIEQAKKSCGKIAGSLFSEMISAAMIAVSTNPNDTEVSKSVLIKSDKKKLSVVGCDQKRLAVAEAPNKSEFSVVIPHKAATALAAFSAESESVEIFCSDNLFSVKSEKGEAGARQLSVQYPNYELVIPKDSEHKIELNPASIVPAIKRALCTSEGELRSLKVTLNKTEAVIATRGHEKGTGQESLSIDCASLNGDELIIGIPKQADTRSVYDLRFQ